MLISGARHQNVGGLTHIRRSNNRWIARTLALIRSFGSLRNPHVDSLEFGSDLEPSDFGVRITTITPDRCPRLVSSLFFGSDWSHGSSYHDCHIINSVLVSRMRVLSFDLYFYSDLSVEYVLLLALFFLFWLSLVFVITCSTIARLYICLNMCVTMGLEVCPRCSWWCWAWWSVFKFSFVP